ncbi:MAG: lipoyl(octanoyl) transferase LipB [Alistipes sp.]|nr:lipoyl(octanoyl) transferase LipB [Alistipes sp.]
MKEILYKDLGLMGYSECWDYQRLLFERMLAAKAGDAEARAQVEREAGWLLLVEHNPVYTLGKSGKDENMLVSESYLRSIGAEFFRIDRGGDVTFHGPGQVVGYPILDLERIGIGLRDYIDALEGAVIDLCREWGIEAGRVAGASGVWIEGDSPRARKICAIGVRSSRYVTMHGFALNVNTDLRYFSHINPCGFVDRGVTSLRKELGHEVDMELVKSQIVKHLSEKLKIEIYK